MFGESIIYTIGTALNRAHDHDIMVEILVQGAWMRGHIVGLDGHGVVLCSDDNLEHAVVRMESISAVRIFTAPPSKKPIGTGGAMVPEPRTAWQ